jgi:hypothetical protein
MSKYGMDKRLLDKAIKKAGTQIALANLYGCSKQNITNIKRGFQAGENFINFCQQYVKDELCTSQQ